MTTPKKRIAIIAAEFNKELVDAMIEMTEQELKIGHAELIGTIRVPGAYEVPLVAELSLRMAGVDGLVVLGHIERGETLHGEVMGHVVHAALVDMQIRHGKPIGIGIIGPGATAEQAEERKIDSARAAVRAVLRSCDLVRQHHD